MPLGAGTVFMCRTTGSDTLNGGCFDPGQVPTGGFTDGAATSATGNSPVFTSASYNFVAGDVGAWVYIASGTNWTPGWYLIASVAANAATLTASIGSTSNTTRGVNTVAGCATVASPTGATWSIDYSRQDAAAFAYTDLAAVGAGLLVSSVAKPFGKQQVGNGLIITGGTNFTTGTYVIASVSVGLVATVVGPGNITTGVGVNGTGGLGGALISLALAAAKKVTSNGLWIKAGTYSITSASTNIAGGCVSWANASGTASAPEFISGFNTVPGDYGTSLTATKPLLQASGAITTFTLFTCAASSAQVFGIDVDAVSKSGGAGILISGARQVIFGCKASNCTLGISATGTQNNIEFCEATNCTTTAAIRNNSSGGIYGCYSHGNTVMGIVSIGGGNIVDCLSVNNTGASSDGFNTQQGVACINNTAYGNGRHGFFDSSASATAGSGSVFINNIAVNSGASGTGYDYSAAIPSLSSFLINNATFGGATGGVDPTNLPRAFGTVILSANPFTNAGSGDFSLNTTAGGGAACRAVGIIGKLLGLATSTGYADLGAFQHIDPTATQIRRPQLRMA